MNKQISLDNGHTYLSADEAMGEINARNLWGNIVNLMDDEVREQVSTELAPCSNDEFLARYLELAEDDLVIG